MPRQNHLQRTEIAALRDRWSSANITRINSLLAIGDLDGIAAICTRASDTGLIDLRGFTLVGPIRDRSLREIDFSHCIAAVSGHLIFVTLQACKFVGAELDHTNVSAEATKCDFSGTKFHVLNGRYVDCEFVRAHMSKINGGSLTFVRGNFSGANWRKATVLDSTFDNCIWRDCKFRSGSFGGSRFLGTRPDIDALGNTMMDDVVFS